MDEDERKEREREGKRRGEKKREERREERERERSERSEIAHTLTVAVVSCSDRGEERRGEEGRVGGERGKEEGRNSVPLCSSARLFLSLSSTDSLNSTHT